LINRRLPLGHAHALGVVGEQPHNNASGEAPLSGLGHAQELYNLVGERRYVFDSPPLIFPTTGQSGTWEFDQEPNSLLPGIAGFPSVLLPFFLVNSLTFP
jgi:hypothetical protein